MFIFRKKKQDKDSNKENRGSSRINNLLRIQYQLGTDTLYPNCRSKDVSDTGIRFDLFQRLEVGASLKLGIYLQDHAEPVLVFGKVAWVKETPEAEYPFEAGIKFDLMAPTVSSKIKEHIHHISISKI